MVEIIIRGELKTKKYFGTCECCSTLFKGESDDICLVTGLKKEFKHICCPVCSDVVRVAEARQN